MITHSHARQMCVCLVLYNMLEVVVKKQLCLDVIECSASILGTSYKSMDQCKDLVEVYF